MPRFQTKRYEQILAQMIAKLVSRTDLSDISDGSVMKHILAAAARQDDEQYFQMSLLKKLFSIDSATGDDLDARAAEIQPGTITRLAASKSTGNLRFSRVSTVGTVNIPVGTQVKTADGITVETTVAGQITAGNTDSGLVAAIATIAGASGNVASGTLIKFVSKPSGVDSVTNPTAFQFGSDKETDDAFRNRIKSYISSLPRSTLESLENAVLGASDTDTGATILFSKGIEDSVNRGITTLYIDDGTGSAEGSQQVTSEIVTAGLAPGDVAVGGEERLYLNNKPIKTDSTFTIVSSTRGTLTGGFSYNASYAYWVNSSTGQINFSPALATGEMITASEYWYYTGLIALGQKIVDGDENDRENYPGYRAAGTIVYVQTPTVVVPTVELSPTILDGYETATVQTSIKEAIKEYVNSLSISGDVLLAELYKRVMGVSGVYNASITAPTSDVVLLDDQIARIQDSNITIN